jgi:putative ABC transport system permease protein
MESTLSFLGEGVDPEAEGLFSSVTMLPGGQRLSPEDRSGVVMGRGLAENLGVTVGDTVVLLAGTSSGGINAVEAKIRSLFYTVSKAYDDSAVRVPLRLAQELLRTEQVHRWIVVLDHTDATTEALAVTRGQIKGAKLEAVPWYQLADFFNKSVTLLSRQVAVVYAIIGVIIVLSISNTLTMTVMERTGEIGTSLALGVKRATVMRRFARRPRMVGWTIGCLLGGVSPSRFRQRIPMPPPMRVGRLHG